MHAIIRRLTVLLIVFHSSFCIRHSSFAQGTEAVIKTKATDALTESIVIPTGKSITINSGATITNNGTATGFGGGGAFSTLTDVTLTSLASGDFLKWNGTAWINRTAANVRTDLGLGTLATQSGTITDYLTTATAATTYQPLDADLTALASATAAGLALMDDADASAQRTTLGLGTLATQNGTIGNYAPLASPTFSGTVTMPSFGLVFPDGGGVIGMEFGGGLNKITLKTASLSGVKTVTIPATTGTLITTGDTGSVTNTMLAGSIDLTTKVTGTLPVANGGTGITALGTGVATWLGTPTVANLNSAVSDADLAILGANSFTGLQTITVSPAATESAVRVTGAMLTGGSGTTNLPHMLVEITGATAATTWSTNGTGFGVNVGTGSRCMDVRQNGAIRFQVDSDGQLNVAGVLYNTQDYFIAGAAYGGVETRAAGVYAWSSNATAYGTQDLKLARAAAGVLDLLGNSTGAAIQMTEQTAPSAPAANKGIIFLEDDGAGKTRLMIRFSTGAAQQIAIEP